MLKKCLIPIAILSATAAAAPALATDASGSITVIRPLTVTKDADLDFGTVIRPSSGSGSASVGNNGMFSASGGAVGLDSTTKSAAQFTLNGEGGQSVSVTVPATFTLSDGSSNSLTVTTTNDLTNTAATTLSNSLGSAGSNVFHVGGSIPITSTTATGAYSGTLTVTASYN